MKGNHENVPGGIWGAAGDFVHPQILPSFPFHVIQHKKGKLIPLIHGRERDVFPFAFYDFKLRKIARGSATCWWSNISAK